QTVKNIAATDPATGATMSCPATTLAVGASMTCTASHTVTQTEMDSLGACPGGLANTVTVISTAPTVTDTLCIPIKHPKLKLVKSSADGANITGAGQKTNYTYTLTNTGDTTLSSIVVSDNNTDAAPVCLATSLAPGGSTTCAA